MSLAIATPLIARGIHVSPAEPGERFSRIKGWPEMATTDPATIAEWETAYPDHNLVCVPKLDGVCILDIDDLKAARGMGLADPPATFTVKSPGGYHVYFLHTERSAALGNRNVGKCVEFKAHNLSVCAPGCTRSDNGGVYKCIDDAAMIPIPDALVDWIERNSPERPKPGKNAPVVAEDFDFEEFCDFYGIEIVAVNGYYHNPRYCPVKGAAHSTLTDCAFFYDGERLGWEDFAATCDGSSMRIGTLIKFLNEEKGERYPQPIFEETDDSVDSFAEDDDEAMPKSPLVVEKPAKAKPKSESVLSPELRASIDQTLKEAAEEENESAELVEGTSATPAAPGDVNVEDFGPLVQAELRAQEFVQGRPEEIPEDALYGQMGRWARETELPLSMSYVAVLAAYSAIPRMDEILGVRFNLYVALCMPVGGGKNLALDRSVRVLGLREGIDYMDCTLGGSGGIFSVLGDKESGKGKDKVTTPGPRKILLNPAELGATLSNTKLDNSTLAYHLCNLWDKSHTLMPVREGKREINSRVSIIGGLPVSLDEPEVFAQYFGDETARGLHSRFLFGYSSTKIDNRWAERWKVTIPHSESADPFDTMPNVTSPVGWSKEAEDFFSQVELPNDHDGRALYNMKRVTLLTATANGDKLVTLACVEAAHVFMLWQQQLKNWFKHGTAQKISSGELGTIIMDVLTRIDEKGEYDRSPLVGLTDGTTRLQISIARVVHNNRWNRYGADNVQRTIRALTDIGLVRYGFRVNQKKVVVKSTQHLMVNRF